MKEKSISSYLIPGAIIIAGLLIALSLFARGDGGGATVASSNGGSHGGFGNNLSRGAQNLTPVSDEDHIRGNSDAAVSIVEFSDFECPFCARLHPTLSRVVEDFDGDVNWVYRHFPLSSIHPRALSAAVASECVAQELGNDAFWSFTDMLFENQRGLSPERLEQTALSLGVSKDVYQRCIADRSSTARVQEDLDDAVGAGGRGTPYSVVISANGELFPFSGALGYDQIASIVSDALEN